MKPAAHAAKPSAATASPVIEDFRADVEGAPHHHPQSLQVPSGSTIVLSWKVKNAPDGVELRASGGAPQRFGKDTLKTTLKVDADVDYELVALAGAKRSKPWKVLVSTHNDGELVSEHMEVKLEDLEVSVSDASGKPLTSACFVEHADGSFEEAAVEKGKLVVASGAHRVHFPELLEAWFVDDAVELEGKDAPEIEIALKHVGIHAGTEAVFTLTREAEAGDELEGAGEEVLVAEVKAHLDGDEAHLLVPQQTTAKWKLSGVGPLDPGQLVVLFCRARVGDLEIDAGELEVRAPVDDDES